MQSIVLGAEALIKLKAAVGRAQACCPHCLEMLIGTRGQEASFCVAPMRSRGIIQTPATTHPADKYRGACNTTQFKRAPGQCKCWEAGGQALSRGRKRSCCWRLQMAGPPGGSSETFCTDFGQEIAQGQVLVAVRHFGFLHCVKQPSTCFAVQLRFSCAYQRDAIACTARSHRAQDDKPKLALGCSSSILYTVLSPSSIQSYHTDSEAVKEGARHLPVQHKACTTPSTSLGGNQNWDRCCKQQDTAMIPYLYLYTDCTYNNNTIFSTIPT